MYESKELRSLVLKLVGLLSRFSYSARSGPAQSCRFLRRPGISDIKENCIMHNLSQREPKKSIWKRVSKPCGQDSSLGV